MLSHKSSSDLAQRPNMKMSLSARGRDKMEVKGQWQKSQELHIDY